SAGSVGGLLRASRRRPYRRACGAGRSWQHVRRHRARSPRTRVAEQSLRPAPHDRARSGILGGHGSLGSHVTDRWRPLLGVVVVICERLAELVISHRHQPRLVARGGFEVGASHYPFMVGVHVAWLAAVTTWAAFAPRIELPFLIAYVLVQPFRAWVMA